MTSIIVAIYNAQAYLEQCLRSLEGQTAADIEVLCVDDCSTDESLAIARRFAERDSRFKVFSTESNSGQAIARNIALQHATGYYITFVDADDWLGHDAIATIESKFDNNVDAVLFDVKMVYGNTISNEAHLKYSSLDGIEAARHSIAWNNIHGVYALRANIHKALPYDTTCRTYSDDITSTLHFVRCRKVTTSTAEYYYRQHDESVTHKPSVRRFDILRAKERLAERLHSEDVPADFHQLAAEQIWRWLIDCCMYEYKHHNELTADELAYGKTEIKRVWKNFNTPLVDTELRHKFGYMHTPWWWTFRLQNYVYFYLRDIYEHYFRKA